MASNAMIMIISIPITALIDARTLHAATLSFGQVTNNVTRGFQILILPALLLMEVHVIIAI
jgi:hypothetical protein